MDRIFISYRREDTADVSGRLYDRLTAHFGKERVFKDVDGIPLGVDFRDVLRDSISACDHMLVVIGRQWLTITDPMGRRRLDNPADFVRIEVEAALARGIPVTPLLVQDAHMPHESDLPACLTPLAYRTGFTVRADPYFHGDMNMLINRVERGLTSPGESPLKATQAAAQPPFESFEDLMANGEALSRQWKNDETLAKYERALALDDKRAFAWHKKGEVLVRLSRYDDAIAACDRSLALDDGYAWSWHNKGEALCRQGRYDEALVAADRAIALDDNPAWNWNVRGWALNGLGRHQEALAAAEHALALDGGQTWIWNTKGWALNALGRHDEALVALDRATSLDSANADSWRSKAVALRSLGRESDAEEAERRAKEVG